MNRVYVSGFLSEEDLRILSTKITSEHQCRTLGIVVRNQPSYQIDSALSSHQNKVDDAAYDILLKWYYQQVSPREAFITLHTALRKYEMLHKWDDLKLFTNQLRKWFEGPADSGEQKQNEGSLFHVQALYKL